jgi:hypothetical protein
MIRANAVLSKLLNSKDYKLIARSLTISRSSLNMSEIAITVKSAQKRRHWGARVTRAQGSAKPAVGFAKDEFFYGCAARKVSIGSVQVIGHSI